MNRLLLSKCEIKKGCVLFSLSFILTQCLETQAVIEHFPFPSDPGSACSVEIICWVHCVSSCQSKYNIEWSVKESGSTEAFILTVSVGVCVECVEMSSVTDVVP